MERRIIRPEGQHIFRGSTKQKLEERIRDAGYYCGSWDTSQRVPTTSFSLDLAPPLPYAKRRAEDYYGTPLLVALETSKYEGRIYEGLEWETGSEVVILGEIPLDDLIVVNTTEEFRKLTRDALYDSDEAKAFDIWFFNYLMGFTSEKFYRE